MRAEEKNSAKTTPEMGEFSVALSVVNPKWALEPFAMLCGEIKNENKLKNVNKFSQQTSNDSLAYNGRTLTIPSCVWAITSTKNETAMIPTVCAEHKNRLWKMPFYICVKINWNVREQASQSAFVLARANIIFASLYCALTIHGMCVCIRVCFCAIAYSTRKYFEFLKMQKTTPRCVYASYLVVAPHINGSHIKVNSHIHFICTFSCRLAFVYVCVLYEEVN